MHSGNLPATKLSNVEKTVFHGEYAKMERALRHFGHHIDEVLANPRMSLSSAKFLERTWYSPKPGDAPSLAQRPFREALTKATILTLLNHVRNESSASTGPSRFRMLSTCPSIGYSDFRDGKVRLSRVSDHFARCMVRRSLHGFGVVDLAIIHGRQADHQAVLGLHVHGACRPTSGVPAPAGDLKAIEPSNSTNRYGLAVAEVSIKPNPLTAWAIGGLAYYVTKISCGLKEDGEQATYTSQAYWTHEHALRALEFFSHVGRGKAIRAVGPLGERLKRECDNRIGGFLNCESMVAPRINHRALRYSWQRLYQNLGIHGLQPVRLVR